MEKSELEQKIRMLKTKIQTTLDENEREKLFVELKTLLKEQTWK